MARNEGQALAALGRDDEGGGRIYLQTMSPSPILLEDLCGGRGRYVTVIDGHEAELTFVRNAGGVLLADHTGVPDALGGKGVGKALVHRLVEDARALGLRIVPACSFVDAQFRRNPDWKDLLA